MRIARRLPLHFRCSSWSLLTSAATAPRRVAVWGGVAAMVGFGVMGYGWVYQEAEPAA